MRRAPLFLILAYGQLSGQSTSTEPALQIRFCDEVALADVDFARLRDLVSATLGKAGVGSVWLYCSVSNPGANPVGCREALKPTEVVLRLRPQGQGRHAQALGVSVAPKDGTGVHAHIHFAQIQNLAARARADLPAILAITTLHEIGHLLMGPAHYPAGIMQSHWTEGRVAEVIRHGLFFQEFQSRTLRVNLAARASRCVRGAN